MYRRKGLWGWNEWKWLRWVSVLYVRLLAISLAIDYNIHSKLLAHSVKFPSAKREPLEKAATSIFETSLSSLTIRLNHPYYLLHQGNCEHFIVIEQVRLLHPSDPLPIPHFLSPPSSSAQLYTNPYPLTLQITPPLPPLCRACTKAPAVYSIVGDMRLGESPCVLCKVCWRALGDSDEGIMVVPLPQYELGW